MTSNHQYMDYITFILKHNANATGSHQTFKYSYAVLTSCSPPY